MMMFVFPTFEVMLAPPKRFGKSNMGICICLLPFLGPSKDQLSAAREHIRDGGDPADAPLCTCSVFGRAQDYWDQLRRDEAEEARQRKHEARYWKRQTSYMKKKAERRMKEASRKDRRREYRASGAPHHHHNQRH